MALNPTDTAALRAYMRVSDDDDAVVALASAAAAEYLTGAGVPAPVLASEQSLSTSYPLYFLALCALALNWFDNRDAISEGTVSLTPLGATAIIKQLQCSNVSDLDTSAEEATT